MLYYYSAVKPTHTDIMNDGEATAKGSSSAQVVELGQEEAGTSDDVTGKAPDVVVIAIDGSKQAETAFSCTFRVLFSGMITGVNYRSLPAWQPIYFLGRIACTQCIKCGLLLQTK